MRAGEQRLRTEISNQTPGFSFFSFFSFLLFLGMTPSAAVPMAGAHPKRVLLHERLDQQRAERPRPLPGVLPHPPAPSAGSLQLCWLGDIRMGQGEESGVETLTSRTSRLVLSLDLCVNKYSYQLVI